MTTVEMIYGPEALKEAMEPSTDPKLREFEEKMLRLQMDFYGRVLSAKSILHDPLPAHYRNIKVSDVTRLRPPQAVPGLANP